jgi:uncharacterized repeat protein (TIGR03803 family)
LLHLIFAAIAMVPNSFAQSPSPVSVGEFGRFGEVIARFPSADGPVGAMVRHSDGNFFFVAGQTIYRITPSGQISVLARLDFGDGPPETICSDGPNLIWVTARSGLSHLPGRFGAVFRIHTTTGSIVRVVRFTGVGGSTRGAYPDAPLIPDGLGNLWGSTLQGGKSERGTIFKINTATGAIATVIDWANAFATYGERPRLCALDAAGMLLGTSGGKAFRLNPTTHTLTSIVTFDSLNPGPVALECVAYHDGSLWGVSSTGIFEVKTATGEYRNAARFDSVPALALANSFPGLVQDSAGNFWGSRETAIGVGTLFKFVPSTGELTAGASIDAVRSFLDGGDGLLWGTTAASKVFTLDPAAGTVATVAELNTAAINPVGSPYDGLVDDGAGNLWGTASALGPDKRGAVFKVDASTGAVTRVAELSEPLYLGRLLLNDGLGSLWGIDAGTTSTANPHAGGLFKISVATGVVTPVGGVSSLAPSLALDGTGAIVGADNSFFTQSTGGSSPRIFKVDPATNAVTILADFGAQAAAGRGAITGLLPDHAGSLWGTSYHGGNFGFGTVFKVNTSTGVISTVQHFTGTSGIAKGRGPRGIASDGSGHLWGTTFVGGRSNLGTVFKVELATGKLTTVVEFTGKSGSAMGEHPGGLTNDGLGFLWGTTGFSNFLPTVFRIHTATGAFETMAQWSFTVESEKFDFGSLALNDGGNLFGVRRAGGSASGSYGEVFRIRPGAPGEVEVLVGDPVPSQPSGTTFGAFGVPEVEQVAATLVIGRTKTAAILAGDGSVRVRVGEALAGATVARLGAPCGDACAATFKVGMGGVLAGNDSALLAGLTAGPVRIAAREGQDLDGIPGVLLKSIGTFDGNGPTVFFLAALQGSGVSPSSDAALCAALSDGRVRVIAREGQAVNGKTVSIIGSLVGLKGTLAEGRWRAGADAIGTRVSFTDKSQALYTIPSNAQSGAGWSDWIGTGDVLTAPLADAVVSALGWPGFGPGGVAFTTALKPGLGGVTAGNDHILMHAGPAGLDLLAREGDVAPDADGTPLIPNARFKTFGDPIGGQNGRVAFLGTLAGVPAARSAALWFTDGVEPLRMIARAGDAAPGGGRWGAFASLALPDGPSGCPLLRARLLIDAKAGISARNHLGLWALAASGEWQVLLRTGETRVIEGALKQVVSFTALAPSAGSIGAAHGYDEDHVAVVARFADGTSALLRIPLP